MVADAYLHPARPFIVDIDRTIVGLCHLHLLALLPHPEFHGLHVLTSAELRSLEVIAGAVVPLAVLPPIYHLVFASRSRIDHPKLSRSILFVHHPYGKGLLLGLQLSQRDLPLLELHARRLLHIVYFGITTLARLCRPFVFLAPWAVAFPRLLPPPFQGLKLPLEIVLLSSLYVPFHGAHDVLTVLM